MFNDLMFSVQYEAIKLRSTGKYIYVCIEISQLHCVSFEMTNVLSFHAVSKLREFQYLNVTSTSPSTTLREQLSHQFKMTKHFDLFLYAHWAKSKWTSNF